MSAWLVLPFALPLAAAAPSLAARRHPRLQRVIGALTLAAVVVASARLVGATRGGEVVTTRVGDWPAEIAIVVAADGFAALVLAVTAVVALVCVTALPVAGPGHHPLASPLALVLVAGAMLALVTADLFNLFVAFEVMLVSSYVLLTLPGGRAQVRAGVVYVAVNVTASAVMLAGIALVYGAAGTVRLADVPDALAATPHASVGLALVAVAVCVKAGVVPLHAWLPRAYQAAPGVVAALFAGLLTKVGVAVLFRLASLASPVPRGLATTAAVVAVATMLVGALGALGRPGLRGTLGMLLIASTGTLVLVTAVWTVDAVTAGIFYLLQVVPVTVGLFLSASAFEALSGSNRTDRIGGAGRAHPWLAAAWLVTGLALAGMPPTSGFVGKYLVLHAVFDAGRWIGGATVLVAGLITLVVVARTFAHAVWARPDPGAGSVPPVSATPAATPPALLVGPALAAAVALLAAPLAPAVLELAGPAAAALVDPAAYLDALGAA